MRSIALSTIAGLLLFTGCNEELPQGDIDNRDLLRITDENAQSLLLASLEFDDISPDLDFIEVSPNSTSGSTTEQCESGTAKVTVNIASDFENKGFSFDGSLSGKIEFDDCMIDGQTYQGSIENDIVFDHFELAGFEALGTVSVVAYYDNFEVSSQEQDLYFDGGVKVVENFTDMEMRLSWDLTATPNNHQKPIRTKTENGIVLNLSTGSYLSGSWIVEGSDDTSVNAYFDTDGNGLEYSVNGSSQQLIPWQDL